MAKSHVTLMVEALGKEREKGFIASANGQSGWGHHPYTQSTANLNADFNNYSCFV